MCADHGEAPAEGRGKPRRGVLGNAKVVVGAWRSEIRIRETEMRAVSEPDADVSPVFQTKKL